MEIFSGKWDFLKGRPKFPNRIMNGKYAFHLVGFTSSRSVGLDRLLSYLPGKRWEIKQSHPHKKFSLGLMCPIYYNCQPTSASK